VRRALPVLVLALAGCGGSDEEQIRDAVDDYREAFLAGDAAGTCSHFTEKSRREFASSRGRATCRDAIAAARDELSAEDRAEFRGLRVDRVKVDGDQAVVTLAASGTRRVTGWRMVKIEGTWLLD